MEVVQVEIGVSQRQERRRGSQEYSEGRGRKKEGQEHSPMLGKLIKTCRKFLLPLNDTGSVGCDLHATRLRLENGS